MTRKGMFAATSSIGVSALVLCTIALVIGNFLLLRQNELLRRDAGQRTRSMAPQIGAELNPLRGLSPDGASITIDYTEDQRQTLLFVFSTECQISEGSWPYWRELVTKIDQGKLRVAFVNLSGAIPKAYTKAHAIPEHATVIAKLDPSTAVEHNLTLSPNILLIDSGGVVREMWLGSEAERKREALEKAAGLM